MSGFAARTGLRLPNTDISETSLNKGIRGYTKMKISSLCCSGCGLKAEECKSKFIMNIRQEGGLSGFGYWFALCAQVNVGFVPDFTY